MTRSPSRFGSAISALFLLLVIAIITCYSPDPAWSTNIVEDDDWTLDLDGSIKGFGFAMQMGQYPASALSLMGWDSKGAYMGVGDFRLSFSGAYKEDKLKWVIMVKSSTMFSSQPNILQSMTGGTSSTYEPPRAFPLQYTQSDDPNALWSNEFDRLMVKFRLGKFDFILGRQPIGLGVGFIWQPADLLGTFSPLEIDKEYKAGVDALRINLALGKFTELSVIGVAGGEPCRQTFVPGGPTALESWAWQNPSGSTCAPSDPRIHKNWSSGLFRFRTTMGDWDLGLLGGYVRGDLVGGLFFSTVLKRLKIRSEATFTHDLDPGEVGDVYYSAKKQYVRAILGANYPFDTKRELNMILELYYNGYGAVDPKDYFSRYQSARTALFGEVQNLGVLYAGYGINWSLTDRVKTSFMALGNLLDYSFHASLMFQFTLSDNSSLSAGGFLPLGKASSFTITDGLTINSEFGLYPKMVYLQYKRYF
ncbi:hypothetical protein KKF84_08900 [Myxococcota bacterium]|nr:hypothetical protein [Myxococcota bacterium]MBU1535427.1 hypothetical protein [Myxococcota bacterium]